MRRGVIFSAVLHLAIALLVIFGLPELWKDDTIDEKMMVVEMVQIAEKSNPPPSQQSREEPPQPKPPEDKPPPPTPQAKPAPAPPPAPPPPQLAERVPDVKPPEPKPEVKPEPQPEPIPEVKKEEPKEPPKPQQQIAKAVPPSKPRPPQQKPSKENFIDSILKNVAPQQSAEKSDAKAPQKNPSPPQSPAPPSLDQQMTMSEIDAVRRQISQCWSVPAGARDARDLIVTIRATVGRDGRVTSARIEDLSRMSDPFYRAAAESAQRAMLNPSCQPLKLPPQKYEQWKDLRIDFNPKDMIG